MTGYVGLTDWDWYRFLLAKQGKEGLDEVNFWKPGGEVAFKVLQKGEPFFFRLHEKHGGAIVGFARFVGFQPLPVWRAWDYFEQKNGAADFQAMRGLIEKYHRTKKARGAEYSVGCIILGEPFFFEEIDWIKGPNDFAKNIVSGKKYDLELGEGKRVLSECLFRAKAPSMAIQEPKQPLTHVKEPAARFGEAKIKVRYGQGTFRALVTEAYGRTCAVTAEHSLPVLEAAHIKRYSEGGEHSIRNGLLLRSDIHRLYDRYFVTISPDHRFLVSPRLKEEWGNGKVYDAYNNKPIHLPSDPALHPDRDLLAEHNETVFKAA